QRREEIERLLRRRFILVNGGGELGDTGRSVAQAKHDGGRVIQDAAKSIADKRNNRAARLQSKTGSTHCLTGFPGRVGQTRSGKSVVVAERCQPRARVCPLAVVASRIEGTDAYARAGLMRPDHVAITVRMQRCLGAIVLLGSYRQPIPIETHAGYKRECD